MEAEEDQDESKSLVQRMFLLFELFLGRLYIVLQQSEFKLTTLRKSASCPSFRTNTRRRAEPKRFPKMALTIPNISPQTLLD
jgi:hypothetical protein